MRAWRGIKIFLLSNCIPLGPPPAPGAALRPHQKAGGRDAVFQKEKKVPNKLSRPFPMAGTGRCAALMPRWSRRTPGLDIFHGFPGSWGHTGGKQLDFLSDPKFQSQALQPNKPRLVILEARRQLQVLGCLQGHASQPAVAQPGGGPLRAQGNPQAGPGPAAAAASG